MANADPHDAAALLGQIREAADLGCDLVRLTVPGINVPASVTPRCSG